MEAFPLELQLHILSFLVPQEPYPPPPTTMKKTIINYMQHRIDEEEESKPAPAPKLSLLDRKVVANACLTCRTWWVLIIELLPPTFVFHRLLRSSAERGWFMTAKVAVNRLTHHKEQLSSNIIIKSIEEALKVALKRGNRDLVKVLVRTGCVRINDTSYHTARRHGAVSHQQKSKPHVKNATGPIDKEKPRKLKDKESICHRKKERIAFNKQAQSAILTVRHHEEESMRERRDRINNPQKKPTICNYHNVQRALKDHPDAIVGYESHYLRASYARPCCTWAKPITREEMAKKAAARRDKKKRRAQQSKAQEALKEKNRLRSLKKSAHRDGDDDNDDDGNN